MSSTESVCEEKLARFKADEKPEAVLVVAGDAMLTKIIVAWPTVSIERKAQPALLPSATEPEWWKWLWDNADYSQPEIAERTGIRGKSLERMMRILIGNRVVYPDGTVNSFVQKYLRDKVLKLFSSTPKRTTRTK